MAKASVIKHHADPDEIAAIDKEWSPANKTEGGRFERKNVERSIAVEWFALFELDSDILGTPVPFHHWDHIPKDRTELSEMLKTDRSSLWRWYHEDPDFQKEIRSAMQRIAADSLFKNLLAVDNIMTARAKAGDSSMTRLFYEQIEKRAGWGDTQANVDETRKTSAEDLINNIALIAERLKQTREIQDAVVVSDNNVD